ncbi:P-loop containing nucleoside triphosphate hydrolase protein [Xylariaceae sp. FL0662B]|nr:P-loop containing nucleoside triphosphate hydrolase protein [Xylariaceae sp. FL0662B]
MKDENIAANKVNKNEESMTKNSTTMRLDNAQTTLIEWYIRPVLDRIHSWLPLARKIHEAKVPSNNLAIRNLFNNNNKTTPEPQPLIIFLLGPPGAGKGTQAALLRASFPIAGLTHLSYGDLLRHHDAIPGSWVNRLPRRSAESTTPLVSADEAVRLLREAIEAGGRRVWLVDGFPRCEAHVEAWVRARMPLARCAVFLECSRDTLVERVLGRAGVSGRPDDGRPELVLERIGRAVEESEGLLEALERWGMRLLVVDASRDVEDVAREVRDIVQEAVDSWELEQGY